MSAVTRPRGRLPSRVYWTRRLLLLLVAAALVVAIAHLLGGTGPGRRSATPVAGVPTGTTGVTRPTGSPTADPAQSPGEAGDGASRPPGTVGGEGRRGLPRPEGPCDGADVLVTPSLPDPHAGEPVEIDLELTTARSPACIWQVSPDTVFVTVDSAAGRVWSSQECPKAVPTVKVVPRRERAAVVTLTWSARESDTGCTDATDWAFPGVYTATAVARGSVIPIDVGFQLGPAQRPTRTTTPTPTATPSPDPAPSPGPATGATSSPATGSTTTPSTGPTGEATALGDRGR